MAYGKRRATSRHRDRDEDEVEFIQDSSISEKLLRDDVGTALEAARIKKKELATYLSGELGPLDRHTARYLVQSFYSLQKRRIAAERQAAMLAQRSQPHALISWLERQSDILEKNIYDVLDYYSTHEGGWTGAWLRSIDGIGPITASAMLGFIDIENSTVAGRIWSYAGLAVGQGHVRGQQSNFNPMFKTICWKVGMSFVYQGSKDTNYYGRVIRERKEKESQLNETGYYSTQAEEQLKKNIKSENYRSTLEKGQLSKAHLQTRAMRYGVKLFLSHVHEVMYFERYGILPPMPFAIAQLGHVDYIAPWNHAVVPGLTEALEKNHRDQAVRASVRQPRLGEHTGDSTAVRKKL